MNEQNERWLHLLKPPAAEVWVASRMPDKLAGVRDGFARFLDQAVPEGVVRVVVTPIASDTGSVPLPLTDAAILDLAITRARALDGKANEGFGVATEAGLVSVRAGGGRRVVTRTWTVVRAVGVESWGASGSLQVPTAVIDGMDGDPPAAQAAAATRRHGGMVASLTDGRDTRRSATAQATYNALCSLLRTFGE